MIRIFLQRQSQRRIQNEYVVVVASTATTRRCYCNLSLYNNQSRIITNIPRIEPSHLQLLHDQHHHHHDKYKHHNHSINNLYYQHQQIRWKGRNDGNRFASDGTTTRIKVNKKKQREYNRKIKKQHMKHSHHGIPGSKASLRRRDIQIENEEILKGDHQVQDPEYLLNQKYKKTYDWDDAILDDLIGNSNMMTPTPEPSYIGHLHKFYYNQVVDQMDDYYATIQQQQSTDAATNTSTTGISTDSTGTIDASTSRTVPSNEIQQLSDGNKNTTTPMISQVADLPTDEMISKALRAYRDRNGTRHTNPIGIIKALQHLLYDMQIPIHAIGEYTYTTLLTCCRTAQEGRRIIQMMREQKHPVSSYSYSILCHLYAKNGDYENCVNVQQEMLHDGISPTLASYTSLLAACYKICNNGRISHSERAKVAKIGWEKWQEMRIIGIEPDVMAYGAIIRLKASTGKPEECINLLEEMPRFNVYPTTLCYTTALRAVARSHAIAIRYEKGISKRNRRRELITQHHGKLARHILILAENANIVKDDGFISALCLCAGEAGDIATAKAIYLANEVLRTQHDSLRRIGSNEHLARLRGINFDETNTNNDYIDPSSVMLQLENHSVSSKMEQQHEQLQSRMVQRIGGEPEIYNEPIMNQERTTYTNNDGSMIYNSDSTTSNTLFDSQQSTSNEVSTRQKSKRYIPSFGEREYGKDSRLLSSILHACAQAVDPNGMGTVWQGRENKGYFCINSLRLIGQPKLPQYSDNSLPGQTFKDNLKLVEDDRDGYREGKRKSRKFAGVDVDEDAGSTMDDLLGDKEFTKRYLNPDGRRKFEYRSFTPDEVWRLKYGDDWDKDTNPDKATPTTFVGIEATDTNSNNDLVDQQEEEIIESYLNSLSETGTINQDTHNENNDEMLEVSKGINDVEESLLKQKNVTTATSKVDNLEGDIYFDYDTMRWKPKSEQASKAIDKTTTTTSPISKAATIVTSNVKEKIPINEASSTPSVEEEELYFDMDIMRWKTRPKVQKQVSKSSDEPNSKRSSIEKVSQGTHNSNDMDSNLDESDPDDDELSEGWETTSDDSDDDDDDYVFDKKKQQWVLRSKPNGAESFSTSLNKKTNDTKVNQNFEVDYFYDQQDGKWKSKTVETSIEAKEMGVTSKESKPKSKKVDADVSNKSNEVETIQVVDETADNERAFGVFFTELRRESLESGQEDVTEEEARELFTMMKDEYNEMITMTPEELGLENHPEVIKAKNSPVQESSQVSNAIDSINDDKKITSAFNKEEIGQMPFEKSKQNDSTENFDVSMERSERSPSTVVYEPSDTTQEKYWSDNTEPFQSSSGSSTQTVTYDPSHENFSIGSHTVYASNTQDNNYYGSLGDKMEHQEREGDEAQKVESVNDEVIDFERLRNNAMRSPSLSSAYESTIDNTVVTESGNEDFELFEDKAIKDDYRLQRLRDLLPGFSDRRLVKIIRCYQRSLGDPSLLDLIPLVRENMPDYITSTWLKQMSSLTATFVIQKAAQDEVINTEILNAVLEMQTSAGSIDRAIEFHQTEFGVHNLQPTEYSDRLVLQMLLRNSRFNRALAFKQTIETSGRSLDIKSYGSLIEFCSRRKQLGSAMLLLKECIAVHGSPPGESSLSNLRLLCRQARIEDEVGLETMIGKDPVEWLRHGERELKREYSKKGRRDVQLTRNMLVRV